jgi:formylglycine-generating enzyme required for sulfatase activity
MLKSRILALCTLLILLRPCLAAQPKPTNAQASVEKPAAKKPLALTEIQDLLKGGVTTKRVATLVEQYGVSFALTDDIEKDLRKLGADGDLLLVIAKRRQPQYPANLKFEFVQIRPGEFDMGCSSGDSECYDSEKPQHRVRISKGFEMGKYPVTQAMWESVMGSNPSYLKGADMPVIFVSWNHVQEFLRRLNAKNDGYRYRLPTEAEWEYAARAGSTSARYGSLDSVAWYHDNAHNLLRPVGQKRPNAWGLYDMLGNIYQWVQDYFEKYDEQSPVTDPQGPSSGWYRVLRGGSVYENDRNVRASHRNSQPPERTSTSNGFRCVREAAK